jgi:hypothetical protein
MYDCHGVCFRVLVLRQTLHCFTEKLSRLGVNNSTALMWTGVLVNYQTLIAERIAETRAVSEIAATASRYLQYTGSETD